MKMRERAKFRKLYLTPLKGIMGLPQLVAFIGAHKI